MRNRTSSLRWSILPVAALMLALGACSAKPRTLEVIYYYKPGSADLATRMAAVKGLEQEFPGRVRTRAVEAGTPEAQSDLEHLEIGTSGIVVRNTNSVLIYKQGDAAYSIDHVKQEIRRGLGMPAAP